LAAVLEALEATADPCDPARWRTARGVLSVNGAKFINWNLGMGGGGAIDLVIHLRQVGFGHALEWLEEHFGVVTPPPSPTAPQVHSLSLPPPALDHWPRVRHYLVQERNLPTGLLDHLFQSGVIYADTRSNAVFLLLDTASGPVGAELRGTSSLRWRGMAAGSRKDAGFFSSPAPTALAIVLCESAIDAISCQTLHPNYLCLSTSGARPDPAWLPKLIAQGLPVYCGFDADPTGDAMAQRMHDLHPSITRLRPAAKDWNDLLRQAAR
jgi:hypothetical protein